MIAWSTAGSTACPARPLHLGPGERRHFPRPMPSTATEPPGAPGPRSPALPADRSRLDQLLVERGHFASREQARRAVMAGLVEVDGRRVDKPGTAVAATAEVRLAGAREPFVSRAGRKLAAALDHFRVDPAGWVCLDVGAS